MGAEANRHRYRYVDIDMDERIYLDICVMCVSIYTGIYEDVGFNNYQKALGFGVRACS